MLPIYKIDILVLYVNPIRAGLFRRCRRAGGWWIPPPLGKVTYRCHSVMKLGRYIAQHHLTTPAKNLVHTYYN